MGKYKYMDGGIITFPVRVSLGGARVVLRTAGSAVGCAAKLGGKASIAATRAAARVSDTVTWGGPTPPFEPSAEAPAREPTAAVVSDLRKAQPAPERSVNGDLSEPPRTQAPPAPDVAPPAPDIAPSAPDIAPPSPDVAPPTPDIAPPSPPPGPEPPAPDHVSEEPELVQEVAEPGAEDGAGAAVTVDEPWPGYARMTAKDVIERLAHATPAELAAVQLYESLNRDRQTVRAAAERNLKMKTGRGSPD